MKSDCLKTVQNTIMLYLVGKNGKRNGVDETKGKQ